MYIYIYMHKYASLMYIHTSIYTKLHANTRTYIHAHVHTRILL